LLSDSLAEAGRAKKAVEVERDSLKSQLATVNTSLKDLEEAKDQLQKDMDELSKDDPDKAKLAQRLKELDASLKSLKADRSKLEAEKLEHGETVKLATETLAEIAIWEIGAKYNLDPVMLKSLNLPVDQTEAVAKSIGTVPKPEPPTETLIPDSGVTSGGGEPTAAQLEKMTPEEYAKWASKRYK
jgi:predicted nuclease with TOPRIM domain